MPSLLIAVLLVLALALPGKAVAGPPEGVSGKMVFVDKVAQALRDCRTENDLDKHYRRLRELAPTHDPRVAVALVDEYVSCEDKPTPDKERYQIKVRDLLWLHFAPGSKYYSPYILMNRGGQLIVVHQVFDVSGWWEENKADLRRRAKQLPQ